jgi:putative transposase
MLPVAPNLLEHRFTAEAPDKVWSSDITYIDTAEGWLYLAALKDLCSGEIVGYAMDERMTRHLIMRALFRAASLRRPAPGLIVHSDSQYCSHEYRALVTQFGTQTSMSRRGNCYDTQSNMGLNSRPI